MKRLLLQAILTTCVLMVLAMLAAGAAREQVWYQLQSRALDEPLARVQRELDTAADLSERVAQLEGELDVTIHVEKPEDGHDTAPIDQGLVDLGEMPILAVSQIFELSDGSYGWIETSGEHPWSTWLEYLVSWALLVSAAIMGLWLYHIRVRDRLEQLVLDSSHPGGAASVETVRVTEDPLRALHERLASARSELVGLESQNRSRQSEHQSLLASVAHEFRTPLARLQFANEMAMEQTGPEQQRLLLEASRSTAEMDALVRETLGYSRLHGGLAPLAVETVSVVELFDALHRPEPAVSNGVRLNILRPPTDLVLEADVRLLLRALGNLLSNALRHADSLVTLSATRKEAHVSFDVIDDGSGVLAAHVEHIFEPFYRVEPSRSRDTGGFGLGLSIVASICRQHDAMISLVPRSGGAHFQLSWPVKHHDAADSHHRSAPADSGHTG